MEEQIQFTELNNSLTTLKNLTEKMSKNLENVNVLVKDNINSGVGIWDSELASLYRSRWEILMEEFPKIMEIFQAQESNLENFINNMKNVEQ